MRAPPNDEQRRDGDDNNRQDREEAEELNTDDDSVPDLEPIPPAAPDSEITAEEIQAAWYLAIRERLEMQAMARLTVAWQNRQRNNTQQENADGRQVSDHRWVYFSVRDEDQGRGGIIVSTRQGDPWGPNSSPNLEQIRVALQEIALNNTTNTTQQNETQENEENARAPTPGSDEE